MSINSADSHFRIILAYSVINVKKPGRTSRQALPKIQAEGVMIQ